MPLRDVEWPMYDGRVRCPWCLGPYERSRKDVRWCSASCKQGALVALRHAHHADVPSGAFRRETYSAERKAATGFGLMTAPDGYRAALRVRCLELGELHDAKQLACALEWAESLELVSEASGVPLERLRALGADVGSAVARVAWVS